MPDRTTSRNVWLPVAASALVLTTVGYRWSSSQSPEVPAVWPLLAVCMAMWVPIGLALLASGGMTEQRAALATLMGLVALGIASLGYLVTGFAFQFGGVGLVSRVPALGQLIWEWSPLDRNWGLGWGVIGLRGFLLGTDASQPQAYLLYLSQLAPLSVAVLLPLLALRGRVKPFAWIVGTAVLSMFTYPVVGNWIWGGGWLANLGANAGLGHGFLDFTGAGSVHLVGASVALAGLLVFVRPRGPTGDDAPVEMPPIHLPMLALMGSFLLIPGWVGLALSNPLIATTEIAWPVVAVNFVLAGLAGALVALIYSWFTTGTSNVFMTARGLVSGLVAISAAALFVPAWSALVIGGIAGLSLPLAAYFIMQVLRLDDQSLIVPMHGVSAAWGLLAAAFFADGSYGAGWNGVGVSTYLGASGQGVTGYLAGAGMQPDFPQQLYAQLIGTLAILVFTFVVSWVLFKLLSKVIGTWEGTTLSSDAAARDDGSDAVPGSSPEIVPGALPEASPSAPVVSP
jgi:ammonium transporter, Amt family